MVDILSLSQYGYGAGRGVDTSLGFCLWYSLYPMGAGFEFKSGVDVAAADTAYYLFVAALFTLAFADDLYLPALEFSKAGVHAVKVASKQCCLRTASACSNLQKDITLIIWIWWDQ